MLRDADYPDGSWRGNGRKAETEKVKKWRERNPECHNKSLCARETGLDRKTVAKWWNGEVATHVSKNNRQISSGEENKVVILAKLFAPGSNYTIEGFTHNELLGIVTSGRWKELGLELGY